MLLDDFILYSESILPGGIDSHISLPLDLKEYFRVNLSRLKLLEDIHANIDNLNVTQRSILDDFILKAPQISRDSISNKGILLPSDKSSYVATPKDIYLQRSNITDPDLIFTVVDRKQVVRGQTVKYLNSKGDVVGHGYIVSVDRSKAITRAIDLSVELRYVYSALVYKWWTKEVVNYKWINTECLDLSDGHNFAALDLEFIVPAYHKPGLVRWSLYYRDILILQGNDYELIGKAEVVAEQRSQWKVGKYELKAKRLNLKGKVVARATSDTLTTRLIDRLQFISTGKIDYKKSLYLI